MAASFALLVPFSCQTRAQGSLPSGWSHRDIGSVGSSGSATYANGTFTIAAAGPQIFGTADGMHFAYQLMSGDGSIVARVTGVQGVRSGTSAEVGVMIRETLAANSSNAYSSYRTASPLVELLWRAATGASTSFINSGSTPLPYWVRMARSGNTFAASISPDGITWTQVGSTQTINMAPNVYVGLAVSSADSNNNSLVTATLDNVSVNSIPWGPAPSPWLDQDIGTVGVPGNASYKNGTFTVSAAGPQIFGATDGMHLVYQPLSGDGTIVARVLKLQNARTGTSAEAGVMIRETLNSNSTNAVAAYRTASSLTEFLWRPTTGNTTSFVNSGASPLPYWVKLARSANTFTASVSPNGTTWTQVGASQTINMAANVYFGLAVSSTDSNNNSLVTATFDNVSVSSASAPAPAISGIWPNAGGAGYDVLISGSGFGPVQGASTVLLNGIPLKINYWSQNSVSATVPFGATSGPFAVLVAPGMNCSSPATFTVLPAGFDQDIGAVGLAGSASYSSGVFTVSAAGPQIFGTADGMHFAYQPLSGDGTIVARISSVQNARTGTSAEAGVMIRETLNPSSANAYAAYRTGGPLVEFLWRSATGGSTSFVNSGATPLPYWVKVTRSGNAFTAFISPNGAVWTQVGTSQTIAMAANAYVGIAVSSADSSNNSLVSATFDNVSVTSPSSQSPTITDINPFFGSSGTPVTIYGANFGAQSANTVTFNGVPATPSVWSPTAIVVPVPPGGTTGNIVVQAGGVNSNGAPFTVVPGPTISSLSPTSGPVGTAVTITGANFGFSQGSSTITFNGVPTATATAWGPTSIQVTVPAGATSGAVAVVVAGLGSNTTGFSVLSSAPTIANLTPASGPVGTPLTISGTNFGDTQGSSTVTLNGSPVTITGWAPTSIAATIPGNAITGSVIVAVSTIPSNSATFTVQPASQSLLVHPSKISLVVGQTQALQLLDRNGMAINSATWTVATPSFASIIAPVNTGDPFLVQANAAGNTTITGTASDGRTGTAQLSILSGTSLPVGTIQWQLPSLGTGGITAFVQSLRVDDSTPDFYAFDKGTNSGNGAIRALSADGRQLWMYSPPGLFPAILMADDQGGLIYQYYADTSFSVCVFARLDETGNQTWSQPLPQGCAQYVALNQQGTLFYVQSTSAGTRASVVGIDSLTGRFEFSVPLPPSTATGINFSNVNGVSICTPGATVPTTAAGNIISSLSVSSDGVLHFLFETSTDLINAAGCTPNSSVTNFSVTGSSNLFAASVNGDGSYSIRQIDSTQIPDAFTPYVTVPDGNGGTFSSVFAAQTSYLYHDNGSVASKVTLPSGQGPSGFTQMDPLLDIVVGEDGTAYLGGPNRAPVHFGYILAVDGATNTIKWANTIPDGIPGMFVTRLAAAPAAGGVVFHDHNGHLSVADASGAVSPLFADSSGTDVGPATADGSPANAASASYWALGKWQILLTDGSFATVAGNNTFLAASESPVPGGSQKKDGKPSTPLVAHFIPVNGSILGLDPTTAINEIIQLLPQPAVAIHRPFIQSKATIQNFTEQLAKPLSAVGFIGHSALEQTCTSMNPPACTPSYSVGLILADHPLVAKPDLGTPQFVVTNFSTDSVVTDGIRTQARIVFIGACDIGPVFKNLWNIQDNTTGQAMIVPVGEESGVLLGHAITAWTHLLESLIIHHMQAQDAVTDTNKYLLTLPGVTEQWQVIGDPHARIN